MRLPPRRLPAPPGQAVGEQPSPAPEHADPVLYAVLGPLEVVCGGQRIEPTSPKQRMLLLDLLIHRGRTLSRDRLIDDLWGEEPPATAAGVLQNYVSALRRALGAETIDTVGPGYSMVVAPSAVDAARFEHHVGLARAARAAADAEPMRRHSSAALELWRGDPLADVTFEAFARAAIAQLSALHAEAIELQLESEILAGRPTQAIPGLEAAVTADPLREQLWWLLMLARYRSGQQAEALRAFQRARFAVNDQLGLEPSARLRKLERAILEQDPDLDGPVAEPSLDAGQMFSRRAVDQPAPQPLSGRRAERAEILAHLRAAWSGERPGLCLLQGEPGIGKTRLLEAARVAASDAASVVLAGRSYQTETGRPFGAWIDALRCIDLGFLPDEARAELAPLLPELGDDRGAADPVRLHDAVANALRLIAADTTITILLDDLHWLDDASASLLHYVVRHVGDQPIALLGASRVPELDVNPTAGRLVETLRRDDQLVPVQVGPLDVTTIAELTGQIAPDSDAAVIAEASNGNPLYAIEMARGLARGDDALSSRLDALIGDRLRGLSEAAVTLLPWLAAFGRGVEPLMLAEVVSRPLEELVEPLAEIEHHGLLHVLGDGCYEFAHDLVRAAAYKRISTPRRAMLHGRIGAVLDAAPDPDDALAADAARHADAAGDSATCSNASARAARRCVRLGAYRDAEEHVARGRRHARRLPPQQRVPIDLRLIHIVLHPALRLHDRSDLAEIGSDLTGLCADAQRLGLNAELSSGLYLMARLHHWGWGDIPRARLLMQRAVDVIAVASGPDVDPIFECARCLAYLEIDMERTTNLFDQLSLLHDLAEQSHQFQWGLGLVRQWNGDPDGARVALRRAVALAAVKEDHWAVFECTARLALLAIDQCDDGSGALVAELVSAAARLGSGGSETRFAAAVAALHAFAGDAGTIDVLSNEIAGLEAIDAAFLVPELLGVAAGLAYRGSDLDVAGELARRAADVAERVAKPDEAARANAILACVAAARGEHDGMIAHVAAAKVSGTTLPAHVQHLLGEAAHLGELRA